ncbi:putative DNA-binding domain-containing protein [Medicago truncatula]|uniref:Putative DNA-binding domain-containing protein n=1 Tax=Medicago truncatula TaxID=3880 RepID=A0A396JFK2_MEDTR|nr:putative DNA-binding domain-containing protein [Medicago truncatula]
METEFCEFSLELEDMFKIFEHIRGFNVTICYIEPHTGQKFRSLVSVHRYLNGGETKDYLSTERMISENKNTVSSISCLRQFLVCLFSQ